MSVLEGDVHVFEGGAGSGPFSCAVFACKELKTKKLPFLGAFSTKMAEEEGFEPS